MLDKDWTFMVYLDADCEPPSCLEEEGIDDFLEMSSVPSSADVNIVVQFDRIPGCDSSYGDWTTCKRFLITPGLTPEPGNQVEDIGEVNMGDPNTLVDFVQWAVTEYPATNYALILWNHGGGWRGLPTQNEDLMSRAVCWDDTSNDRLYMNEVQSALSTISGFATLHLIGFDACLMGMVEVAYEIRYYGSVMVGSAAGEPMDGWPYDTILSDLTSNPGWNAAQLGTAVVDRFGKFYTIRSLKSWRCPPWRIFPTRCRYTRNKAC